MAGQRPLWASKSGLTRSSFQGRRAEAESRHAACTLADKDANAARGTVSVAADAIDEFCVKWYELATATFPAGTLEGDLVRTIPTTYQPRLAPGALQFAEHDAPAPNQVRLEWKAVRGERFNIYAKAPGGSDFDKMLDGVTDAAWVGTGLAAGVWSFKGEALNAAGLGEASETVTVPVAAALAA